MNKITVLKSRGAGYSMMLGDTVSTINPNPVTVEITDEEIENEADKVHKSNGLHVYYIDGYHDGFMAAYEFIKSRINQ